MKVNKTLIEVLSKCADFADMFFPKLAIEFSKHIKINDHAIKLVDDWQPPYNPIYSLGYMRMETLKAYIKNHLANGFIRPFKSPAGAFIFLNKKRDGSLILCINYQGLNNLIIKNRYSLSLVGESLDQLDWNLYFT